MFDIDDIVISRFGTSIPEIFAKHGEDEFREVEAEALRELRGSKQAIIVTGGGIVLREENVEFLKRLGVVVWLVRVHGAWVVAQLVGDGEPGVPSRQQDVAEDAMVAELETAVDSPQLRDA